MKVISVAEFFRKNIHLLGFDNPSRALLTTIREAVDNSLDACEEAGILPEIKIEIERANGSKWDPDKGMPYIVTVEDNGPGVPDKHVGRIFGKLLYGSKFHKLRQSRGQQGIGISASVLYAQLSCNKPAEIWTNGRYYKLTVDVQKNEPVIIEQKKTNTKRTGVKIRLEIMGLYYRGARSVDSFLRQVCLANPCLRLVFNNKETNERTVIERTSEELPPIPTEIKPHPHGLDLGHLGEILTSYTNTTPIKTILKNGLSRVTAQKAMSILRKSGLNESTTVGDITQTNLKKLYDTIQETQFVAPRGDCLSPIGAELLEKGLRSEIEADFYKAITRPIQSYRGNPFRIEVGIAYGGPVLPADKPMKVLRIANKVPLLYNQTGGAIQEVLTNNINWTSYGLPKPSKGHFPVAPCVILIHIVSVWIPYSNEGKQNIAKYPEIMREIKLAVQDCCRDLGTFIKRRKRIVAEQKRKSLFATYAPLLTLSLSRIVGSNNDEELLSLLLDSNKTEGNE